MNKRVTDTVELKKYMIEKGLERVNSLSAASGISRNTLSCILNGKTQPSADVMNKLIATLDIPPTKAGEIFFSSPLRNT